MRDRLRQRALISLLKTHDGPPTILAVQIFFLFDEPPLLAGITDNMTIANVIVEVGGILRSQRRLSEDIEVWAKELFKQAGLPFDVASVERVEPGATLSVVPSQPATPKTVTSPTPPKRKTRRVYLELAIKLLERGSCTHRDLVDSIMKRFPNLNRETVSTFVSDVQNEKYSPIRDRKVVKQVDGKLIFEDCVRPSLTVIENPNYGEKEEVDVEPVTGTDKQVTSSIGDV